MTSSAETQTRSAAHAPRWPAIEVGDREPLGRARTEAINLVQWLARIANSFVSGGTPEERILLEFRADDVAFVTQLFDRDIAVEIRLPSLEMQFLEGGRPMPHIFDPEDHSPAEVEAWLLVELLHRGLDRTGFSKNLPYSVPNLMTGDAEDHSPQACRQGLTQLAAWFRNAAAILAAADGTGKARVVCLPQTLNLICLSGRGSEAAFGFSPGDARFPEPSFYLGAADGRQRAILTASQLAAETDPAAAATRFIKAAVACARPASGAL
jgi:hypothetical protein